MKTHRSLKLLLMVLALVATACGGATRDGAIEELVSEGIQEATANCLLDEVEKAGFTAEDVADPINPEVEPVIEASMPVCITDEDVPGLLGVDSMEEAEALLATQIADTGAMTSEQATCVIENVLSSGFGLTDIAGMSADAESSGVADALAEAGTTCLS